MPTKHTSGFPKETPVKAVLPEIVEDSQVRIAHFRLMELIGVS